MQCPICNEENAVLVSSEPFTKADVEADEIELCFDPELGKVAAHATDH